MTTPGCDSDETNQYGTGLVRSSWLSSAPTCTPQNTLDSTTISEAISLQNVLKVCQLSVAVVAPVLGPDSKLIGIAALWIRATSLWNVAKASNELAGPGSFAVLFDHQGIRIAHTYNDDIVFYPGGRLDPGTVNALVAERRFGERTRQLLEEQWGVRSCDGLPARSG